MMLKNTAAALAVASLVAGGCSSDSGVHTNGQTYSLTVFAYDAVTGAPIPTAALTSGLALYEESNKVQPSALNSGVNGAVIFNGIPADYASGSSTNYNKYFPLIGNIDGYQPYQGSVSFTVGLNNGGAAAGTLQDDLFAQVGTIYLFPVGFKAPDYTFSVFFNGKPVPGAVVELDPGTATSVTEKDSSGPITTVAGHSPALSGTTDANGKVTFAGTTLALGVTYKATLLPLTFEGIPLAEASSNITAGVTNAVQTISASALVQGTTGLYVSSISNHSNQLDATGTLTIVFSRPVALTSPNGGFTQSSSGTVGGALAASPNISLSADGLTLTLTPAWTTAPTTINPGATVSYASGTVYVVGYPALGAFNVFNLAFQNTSAAISGTVQIKAN